MEQAHLQALITEVQILKRDLKRYMSTTELEKQVRLAKMNEDMSTSHKSSQKTIIATAGTVVAGLLSTVVVILMKMPG